MADITQNGTNVRQSAVKISIIELLLGTYIQDTDQNPNYLQTRGDRRVYRLNVVAIIIQQEVAGTITNFLIDDSTGMIVARFFEESGHVATFKVGDVVRIIGKIRTYNQEKYISPEIIKKVNPLWLKIRLKEAGAAGQLEQVQQVTKLMATEQKGTVQSEAVLTGQSQIQEEEVVEESVVLPYQKIMQLIQNLDAGEGVQIEEIIEKSPLQNTEKIIEMMLKKGDIFQNSPGKVKVL